MERDSGIRSNRVAYLFIVEQRTDRSSRVGQFGSNWVNKLLHVSTLYRFYRFELLLLICSIISCHFFTPHIKIFICVILDRIDTELWIMTA
jgi:hypothetical protein